MGKGTLIIERMKEGSAFNITYELKALVTGL